MQRQVVSHQVFLEYRPENPGIERTCVIGLGAAEIFQPQSFQGESPAAQCERLGGAAATRPL